MEQEFATVDEYIESFEPDVQKCLRDVREAMLNSVPNAEEKIRYGMPAVILNGRYALHYAAWRNHIGMYPVDRAEEPLESEIAPYRAGKDSVNFPYNKPIPLDLIERIAAFMLKQHEGSH